MSPPNAKCCQPTAAPLSNVAEAQLPNVAIEIPFLTNEQIIPLQFPHVQQKVFRRFELERDGNSRDASGNLYNALFTIHQWILLLKFSNTNFILILIYHYSIF